MIARRRREKGLTQAQLAEKLRITDRAVSKWETGKNVPDTALVLELCEILGVTPGELLRGRESGAQDGEKKEKESPTAPENSDKRRPAKNAIIFLLFSFTLFTGAVVCAICDLAVSGELTWAPVPVASVIFAWAVVFPATVWGKRGVCGCLLSLSVFLIPYLYLLGRLLGVAAVFSIGVLPAAISIVFSWLIYAVFRRCGGRKLLAGGVTFLLLIPFTLAVNAALSKTIGEPPVDVWDILTFFVLASAAFALLACDFAKRRGLMK